MRRLFSKRKPKATDPQSSTDEEGLLKEASTDESKNILSNKAERIKAVNLEKQQQPTVDAGDPPDPPKKRIISGNGDQKLDKTAASTTRGINQPETSKFSKEPVSIGDVLPFLHGTSSSGGKSTDGTKNASTETPGESYVEYKIDELNLSVEDLKIDHLKLFKLDIKNYKVKISLSHQSLPTKR